MFVPSKTPVSVPCKALVFVPCKTPVSVPCKALVFVPCKTHECVAVTTCVLCAASGSSPSTHGSCSGDVSLVSGCSPVVTPTLTDVTKFQFAFHECATPYVSSISTSSVTTLDGVTFAGSGFGGVDCQNEVCVVCDARSRQSEIQCVVLPWKSSVVM